MPNDLTLFIKDDLRMEVTSTDANNKSKTVVELKFDRINAQLLAHRFLMLAGYDKEVPQDGSMGRVLFAKRYEKGVRLISAHGGGVLKKP